MLIEYINQFLIPLEFTIVSTYNNYSHRVIYWIVASDQIEWMNERGCSMWVVDTVHRSLGNVFTALPLIVLIHARYSNFIRFIKVDKNKENSFTDWRLAESTRARTHWYLHLFTHARSSFSLSHQSATAPRSSNFINNYHPFHKLLLLQWNLVSVSVLTNTWFFCWNWIYLWNN